MKSLWIPSLLTGCVPHPSNPHQGRSPSWTLLVSREGVPKPTELFQTQQESSLTPTTAVPAGLSGSDEASPTTQSALGHGIAVGASATVENPG